jgi:cytochrome b561
VSAALERFTPLQRLLHWLMALCILAMLFIGVGMVSTAMPKYLTLVSIHKPLGIAILVLVLIRLAVRLRSGAPPLPADLPPPMKYAAELSHYALYALMIAMPLIGWAMLSAAAYPVVLFPGVLLPAILPQSDRLHALLLGAHVYLAFAFFALILLHAAAALFHALVRRDGVFETMAPTRKRSRQREEAAALAFAGSSPRQKSEPAAEVRRPGDADGDRGPRPR